MVADGICCNGSLLLDGFCSTGSGFAIYLHTLRIFHSGLIVTMNNANRKAHKEFNAMYIPIMVNPFGAGIINNVQGYFIQIAIMLAVILCLVLSIMPFILAIMGLASGATDKIKAVASMLLPLSILDNFD
ncbi:MAG: hypothetical protein OEX12_11305 [Gammaproteobacteria bacterium]|nr:hypothetical protein [Gammaproteobacteria bacterium]